VSTPWQGWLAAAVVTAITLGLVLLDLLDSAYRRWWAGRALTADTVAGVLGLLITVLVVDQVVKRRQVKDRSRAVGAQAAIVMAQALSTSAAVSSALNGSGDRTSASDELRTYMIMLLVGAPVLIEARLSRHFLEQAQHLGAEMARALAATVKTPGANTRSNVRLNDAVEQLRAASAPLVQTLDLDELLPAPGDLAQ
jgi:Co/Zn/Cd efflux system component